MNDRPKVPPLMLSGLPGDPTDWPRHKGCPRCGGQNASLDPVEPRFLLLKSLEATTCRDCGFHFMGKSGRSVTPVIVAAYCVPICIAAIVVLFVVVFAEW